jgi:hypothetical protein
MMQQLEMIISWCELKLKVTLYSNRRLFDFQVKQHRNGFNSHSKSKIGDA